MPRKILVFFECAAAALLAVLLCVACCGCGVPCRSIDALDNSFGILSEEFLEYVDDDPNMEEAGKERRRGHVAEHRALLSELRALCEGR